MKRAILFDLEGVIIETEELWDEVSKELLGRRGITYERGVVKHLMMGRTLKEGVGIMKEKLGLEGDLDELVHERRLIAREVFSREVEYIPGAKEFIGDAAKEYAVAVATSMERGFFRGVDEKLKLTERFKGHVYSIEDIGFVSKPNPDIFLYAAKNLGVEPAECIVFEDAPNGILAAKRAGMKCVALTTSVGREKLELADRIIDSYAELKPGELKSMFQSHE